MFAFFKKRAVLSHRADTAHEVVEASIQVIDAELRVGGLAQNVEKLFVLPISRSRFQNGAFYDKSSRHMIEGCHRYLGELCFLGSVYSVGTSGLYGLILSQTDHAKFNSTIIKMLWALNRGAATQDETGKCKKIKTDELLKQWKPVELTLQQRRLEWYQAFAVLPESHQHLLATWFGQAASEKFPTVPTVCEQGVDDEANPDARRFVGDLQELGARGVLDWVDTRVIHSSFFGKTFFPETDVPDDVSDGGSSSEEFLHALPALQ